MTQLAAPLLAAVRQPAPRIAVETSRMQALAMPASASTPLGLDGGSGGDVLSALLNGTSLLGDCGGSDGLLNGAIVTADGNTATDAGISVDPGLAPAVGGVLDGLLASTDLLHASDCGCGST